MLTVRGVSVNCMCDDGDSRAYWYVSGGRHARSRYTLDDKDLKINLQRLISDQSILRFNINLKDLIQSYKHLELNQKYLKIESFGFKFKSQLIGH